MSTPQAREPAERSLERHDLAPSWHEQLERWLEEARGTGLAEPTAMVLATADADGVPSARAVLLKGLSGEGLVFYTNLRSRKGLDIAANPAAAAVFPWFAIHRQAIVSGRVEPLDAAAADAYFASRPYRSRISAHASRQSRVIADRAVLEAAHAELTGRFPEHRPVPRPGDWGGLRLVPDRVEFWQGRADRLHDRLCFRLDADGDWLVERLSP